MLRKTLLVIALVGLSSLIVLCEPKQYKIVGALFSKVSLERQAVEQRLLKQRSDTIQELIWALDEGVDRSFDGTLHRAIRLLGKLRADEAVGPLSRLWLLYIPDNFVTTEMLPSEAYYVVAVALKEIGNPAVPVMLATIGTSSVKRERDVAAWVIMEVEGREYAISLLRVRIDSEVEPLKKAPYEDAIKFIENYQPVFKHPSEMGSPKAQ